MPVETANKSMLSAKLHPQRVVRALVARTQLIEEINSSDPYPKLTVLTAPAGFGKSTLLFQLMDGRQKKQDLVAWLSLDKSDNSLNTFSAYVVESYNESVNFHDFPGTYKNISEHPNANPKQRLTLLFDAVMSVDKPFVLILDDYHVLTNSKLLKFIDWLVESMPMNMSLIISSRSRPKNLSLPTLKAKGNLVEVDAKKLKFSVIECKNFFRQDKSILISDQSIDVLCSKSEGWIAALQLSLIAMRELEDQASFVRDFSGTDRDIVSYLGHSVLQNLDKSTLESMLRTSILERMNGELFTLLTGIQNAEETIAKQEVAGLFIFAIDRENKWFRYHHLFRELLLSELIEKRPDEYTKLCLLTANWFKEHNKINDAVSYYLKAKEYDLAAELIAQNAASVVQYSGHHETLFEWLEELPSHYINIYPEIFVSYLWSLTFTRCLNEIDAVLASFKQSRKLGEQQRFTQKVAANYTEYNLEMLDILRDVMNGDPIASRLKSSQWLEKWENAPSFETGTVLGTLGASCLHTLEFELGRESLKKANKAFYDCNSYYGISWMDCIYALICMRQGFVTEARNTLEKSLELATLHMGELSYSSTMLSLGLAQVYYELNDIEKSKLMLKKGFVYLEEHGVPDSTISGYVLKARIQLHDQLHDQAITTLLAGERFCRELQILNLEPLLALERGRLCLHLGKVEMAKVIFNEQGFADANTDDLSGHFSPYEQMQIETFHIRLLIIQDKPENALNSLNQIITKCSYKNYWSLLTVLNVLKARVLADSQDVLKAMRILEKAIEIAASENSLRILIDEKQHLEFLLPKLIQAKKINSEGENQLAPNSYISQLCQSLGIETGSKEDVSHEGDNNESKLEQLTKRESAILNLLEQGLSNQKLADSLFVSLATIKWHLANIYTKLGVSNKIQAINIARKR